jgi:hypothetical protein
MPTDPTPPYVDLRLDPYALVADDATAAVAGANTAAVKQALADYATIPAEFRFPPGTIYFDKDTVVTAVHGCRYTWQYGDKTQDFYKSTGTGNTSWSTALGVP